MTWPPNINYSPILPKTFSVCRTRTYAGSYPATRINSIAINAHSEEAAHPSPLIMATNVHWHNSHVTRSDRERKLKQRGVTVSTFFCIRKAHKYRNTRYRYLIILYVTLHISISYLTQTIN